jgi:hypothetical protein
VKVFLDDRRPAPEGWILVRWPEEAIALLERGGVEELSLDHDLGDDGHGTGYDVLTWIEEAVATRGFAPPRLHVHSANASARLRMEAAVRSIASLAAGRRGGGAAVTGGGGYHRYSDAKGSALAAETKPERFASKLEILLEAARRANWDALHGPPHLRTGRYRITGPREPALPSKDRPGAPAAAPGAVRPEGDR